MPDHVIIFDEYSTPWRITEEDLQWEEAKAAVEEANGARVVWPIAKLVQGRGWGWWSVYKRLSDFEDELSALVPNPAKQRLIDVKDSYTTTQLRDMLQHFGSYLSTLHNMEGLVEARCHALKEGLKTGLQVAVSQSESKASSVTAREGEIMSTSEVFKMTRKMQIEEEACLLLVTGWRKSYEAGWNTISRLITQEMGEASLATTRHQ